MYGIYKSIVLSLSKLEYYTKATKIQMVFETILEKYMLYYYILLELFIIIDNIWGLN